MAAKIKKGDKVVVLAGKDKGKNGEVIRVMPKENKARGRAASTSPSAISASRRQRSQGGLIAKEMPIHLSNLALADRRRQADPRRLPLRRTARRSASPRRSGEVIDG